MSNCVDKLFHVSEAAAEAAKAEGCGQGMMLTPTIQLLLLQNVAANAFQTPLADNTTLNCSRAKTPSHPTHCIFSRDFFFHHKRFIEPWSNSFSALFHLMHIYSLEQADGIEEGGTWGHHWLLAPFILQLAVPFVSKTNFCDCRSAVIFAVGY